jgi:hypothetical protein
MPRRRKTQSGAPAQEIKSVPGQRYGEGVQQAQMQRAMPAPNRVATAPQPSMVAAQQAASPTQMQEEFAAVPVPSAPVDPVAALASIPKNLFGEPDDRPVTSGLSFGPGRPASIMGAPRPAQRPTTRMLQMLYDTTNDPMFARLLERFTQ